MANQRAQIVMSHDEIDAMISGSKTATMATIGPDGQPHLVAMWFGYLDGEIWFETKVKSQKAVNLIRDSRISVLVEDGETYETLRGVSIEGTGEIIDDPERIWPVGVAIYERHYSPYNEEARPIVEFMLKNRVVVRVVPQRVRSWDHRKLGL